MKIGARKEDLSIGMLEPLDFQDPAEVTEFEVGDEFEETYRYIDGHEETGRTRYMGKSRLIPAAWNDGVPHPEKIRVPELHPLTPLSEGGVQLISRMKR